MGSFSDYLENEILDHILEVGSYTPAATVYIGLSTADPLDTAAGLAEPVGNNYAREAITFAAASSRSVASSGTITFNQASGSWGTITHYAIFDALTNGNMLAHGSLSASKAVTTGNTPSIASGQVTITFSAGAASNYLANIVLDFVFRNQAFSAPGIYVALCTADLSDSSTGATMTECADANNYARVDYGTWDAAAGGVTANTNAISFANPSGSWGTVTAACLLDSGTYGAGNVLFYDNTLTEQEPVSGDTVQFAAGDFDITLS